MTSEQQSSLTLLAERVMGLQMVVVCIMAATLFGMLRRRGESDAEECDPMGADDEGHDNDVDENRQKEAERRVARAAVVALCAGAVGAACVASVSS